MLQLKPNTLTSQVTHIIVDEVHEREMYSDFLLNIMRDILPVRPYLRLVLMTADPDPKELQVFFEGYELRPFLLDDRYES